MAFTVVQSCIAYSGSMHGAQSPDFVPTSLTATMPNPITPGNFLVFFVASGQTEFAGYGVATNVGDMTSWSVENSSYDPATIYNFVRTDETPNLPMYAGVFIPRYPFPDVPNCTHITYTAPYTDNVSPNPGYQVRFIAVELSGFGDEVLLDQYSLRVLDESSYDYGEDTRGYESVGVNLPDECTVDGLMLAWFCNNQLFTEFATAPIAPFQPIQYAYGGADYSLNGILGGYNNTHAGDTITPFTSPTIGNVWMIWPFSTGDETGGFSIGVNLIPGMVTPSVTPSYPYPYYAPRSNPFNLSTVYRGFYRVAMKAGDAMMWQTDLHDPSKGWRINGAAVTELGDVSHARMAFDAHGLLRVIFDHAGNVYEAVSADGGKTFEAMDLIFPAAKYADITASAGKIAGTILIRAVYIPDQKQLGIVEQWGGGTISEEWNPLFLDAFGNEALQVEDDTFRITSLRGLYRSWYLHTRIAGEGQTSGWVSTDYCRTFTRLDGIAIVGGTHPTVMAGPRLSEMVWSAYVPADNTLRGVRVFGGTPEPFVFQQASGQLLGTDGDFYFEQAREPMARYILSLVAAGDSDVSEWWSKDYAGSWTRL